MMQLRALGKRDALAGGALIESLARGALNGDNGNEEIQARAACVLIAEAIAAILRSTGNGSG